MKKITLQAPAKLNLTLEILGRRSDGYHELDMLMQSVSLYDKVTIVQGANLPWTVFCSKEDGSPINDIPCDRRNLAWKAAEIFFEAAKIKDTGVQIHITKNIPSQAGLAGGSADAAAVLIGLNRLNSKPYSLLELCKLGEKCGSDVPFCILGGTARVQGRGEILNPIPINSKQYYIICKPSFGLSTPELFALSDQYPTPRRPDIASLVAALKLEEWETAGSLLCNVMQDVALQKHPEIDIIRNKLIHSGACGAQMTGSGSAVFGLFATADEANSASQLLCNENFATYLVHSI